MAAGKMKVMKSILSVFVVLSSAGRQCHVVASDKSEPVQSILEQDNVDASVRTGAEVLSLERPFPNQNISSSSSDSCISVGTCKECNGLSRACHWCSHDQKCHAIGSFHGCAFGSSCEAPNDDDKKKNADNDSCFGHKSCRECSLSSRFCHWCGFDNACHSKGSLHGCVTGVDCYDNDRCQRKAPEPLPTQKITFRNLSSSIGLVPLLAVIGLTTLLLMCATCCFCCARGVKGAYDDLADLTEAQSTSHAVEEVSLSTPLLQEQQQQEVIASALESDATPGEGDGNDDNETNENAENSGETAEENGNETTQLLTDTEEGQTANETNRNEIQTPAVSTISRNNGNRRRPRRSMQRLYNACVCCYLLTLLIVVGFACLTIRYFPRVPVYNICNDNVAWKSLVDSLAKMKASADFEILASVSNTNYIDVALDEGKGTFHHKGAFAGTFDIPPTIVAANAITDILVVAHFTPDKWDAMSLTEEFYRGKLILDLDASATIRIPAFFDYSFEAELKDLKVNINEQSDRSFCNCPTWDDNASLPDFMQIEM